MPRLLSTLHENVLSKMRRRSDDDRVIIGIPKEVKEQEHRVALLPSAAYQLIKRGHRVLVGSRAGEGIGFGDDDYAAAGATIVESHEALFAEADMIVKVKEPLPSEYGLLRTGQILFTYLHLAANRTLTDALLKTCLLYTSPSPRD